MNTLLNAAEKLRSATSQELKLLDHDDLLTLAALLEECQERITNILVNKMNESPG